MPRTTHRLTEAIVRSLTKPGFHHDGSGLYLQISKAGTKSWVYRFTINGRTRDMGLGALASMTLGAARTRVGQLRPLVASRIDPLEQARAAAPESPAEPVPTFRSFAEKYIDDHEAGWRNTKHRKQWRNSLETYAYPHIGSLTLDKIGTREVLNVLEPIWRVLPETASRVRGRIERILAAAAVRELRPATNPAMWRGHLSEVLSARTAGSHYTSMHYHGIPGFMEQLGNEDSVSARALEFVILTAARSGEVRLAKWDEIDEAGKVWTVPADRMKARREHAVPLSDGALAILEEMRPLRNLAGGYIFPGLMHDKPLSDMSLTALVQRRMGHDVTVHGFRATFKTWAENETEHPNVVIESALSHIVGDKAEQAYMRGDRLEKRRRLMEDWAAYCASEPVQKVVPIRAG